MSYKTLLQVSNLKVLVLGDLILDEYLWGSVERISPEAPVQVLETKSENFVLGGASNVANNLYKLGCMVFLVGVIGQDEKGDKLLDMLIKNGINIGGVFRDKSRPTTNKIRIIAQNQQILRIDKEESQQISLPQEKEIITYIKKIIPKIDGIICSDYNKGILTPHILESIIKTAKSHKKMVFLDPKGKSYAKYKGVDVITPNELELRQAVPFPVLNAEDIKKGAEYLLETLGAKAVLVTRGKDGMSLFEGENQEVHIPTQAKEVYDVTGAGDTVISTFALAALSGFDLVESARLANKAAGLVVGKLGTATVSRDELVASLEEELFFDTRKILTVEELKPILAQNRLKGKKIVFTNGCFDLLHIGHIQYLKQAKKLGDILVLGLNNDESIKTLKGPKRPFINENERANILAALDCIDYITIFSDLTPLNLIQEVRPDILVKGGDYLPDQVVGKDTVESYGGRVEIVPLLEGKSTSNLVSTIVNKYNNG